MRSEDCACVINYNIQRTIHPTNHPVIHSSFAPLERDGRFGASQDPDDSLSPPRDHSILLGAPILSAEGRRFSLNPLVLFSKSPLLRDLFLEEEELLSDRVLLTNILKQTWKLSWRASSRVRRCQECSGSPGTLQRQPRGPSFTYKDEPSKWSCRRRSRKPRTIKKNNRRRRSRRISSSKVAAAAQENNSPTKPATSKITAKKKRIPSCCKSGDFDFHGR
ncbi:Hypothetical protein FKW44_025243 [Caligus rogercresseyi]|uniref:Uncharacterized protein n=1 Tax=Caligus rogercresseyi TaxID=217165 RepID=A0A7T8JSD7_CALRO|nr:Hypothetical protein FKW44_025243 [Caligus rogercresseyi]